MIDERIPPPTYGVWIPTQGWLKGEKGVYADYHRSVAEQVARRVGSGARVYFVDNAIQDLEQVLLVAEKENTISASLKRLMRMK